MLGASCTINNKNPETDTGDQPEDQKSKPVKPLESSYLYEVFRLKGNKFLSHPALYSSLVLGLKVCMTFTQPHD